MTGGADLPLVERVVRESGVDRTPAAAAGWGEYVVGVSDRIAHWVSRAFPDLSGIARLATHLGPVLVVIVVVLVVLILAALLYALVGSAWRRRRRTTASRSPAVVDALVPAPERDAAGWRAELDRCLSAGDLAGALLALWWWFARSVAGTGVDGAWTSRELLLRSGRTDLMPAAARLDRLLYGPGTITPQRIRECAQQLAQAVE